MSLLVVTVVNITALTSSLTDLALSKTPSDVSLDAVTSVVDAEARFTPDAPPFVCVSGSLAADGPDAVGEVAGLAPSVVDVRDGAVGAGSAEASVPELNVEGAVGDLFGSLDTLTSWLREGSLLVAQSATVVSAVLSEETGVVGVDSRRAVALSGEVPFVAGVTLAVSFI